MILALLVAGPLVWLAFRKGRNAGPRRDWLTILSLVTWRPLRRYWPWLVAALVVRQILGVSGPVPALLAVGVIAGVWLLSPDVRVWERRNRLARQVADRWVLGCVEARVQAADRWLKVPYPMPRSAVVNDAGNVTLTVELPVGMTPDMLAARAPEIGPRLRAQGLQVVPDPARPMQAARVSVLARQLTGGRPLDVVAAPANPSHITIGNSAHGPIMWDLDDEPGIGIFGGTGAGKGVLGRWMATQILDDHHNRELWIIDPQASAEWTVFADHPRVRLLQVRADHAVEDLAAIVTALDELAQDVTARNQACSTADADGWRHLPDQAKAAIPRRILLLDEASALLAKVPASDPTREHRAAIGSKLATLYRTVRKAGIGFMHLDQATYQGDATLLGEGALGQLGRWVALGGMRPETRQMISGFQDWPYVASRRGVGITGLRAATDPDPIEIPWVDRAAVVNTLTGWGHEPPAAPSAPEGPGPHSHGTRPRGPEVGPDPDQQPTSSPGRVTTPLPADLDAFLR